MSGIAATLLAALFLVVSVGCEDYITRENYDQIEVGMTIGEVEDLLGGSGEDVTPAGTGISGGGVVSGSSSNDRMFRWSGSGKEITVTVSEGKVISKGKAGI